mmetsp:Transcript_13154/g.33850  ORF Transcript_13154/g.33850 Transcript_13154/m.33850 type:complete len:102 (+) Transcript_13154:1252-1557(+)
MSNADAALTAQPLRESQRQPGRNEQPVKFPFARRSSRPLYAPQPPQALFAWWKLAAQAQQRPGSGRISRTLSEWRIAECTAAGSAAGGSVSGSAAGHVVGS